MAKKIDGYIKLNIPAGAANPSPPVGPALGQRGINIMEFCKAFNASTEKLEKNMPIPVVITVFADKSFNFIIKTPPASVQLLEASKLKKGSAESNRVKVATVTWDDIKKIAMALEKDILEGKFEIFPGASVGDLLGMSEYVEGIDAIKP